MAFDINGNSGKYDGQVKDDSVRYGRNAVDNNKNYMESPIKNGFGNPAPILDFRPTEEALNKNIDKVENFANENEKYLKSLPPLEFEYRYMPNITNGNIDKKALLGAAYEEMGKTQMPVKEFEEKFVANSEMTAEPLDINKDGNIDVAEYGSSILAADMLSKDEPDVSKIDGTINSKGLDAIAAYSYKSRATAAAKLYSQMYSNFKLNELG